MKRRYLAVAIDSPEQCSSGEFIDAVWGSVSRLYGEYGASKTGLVLISFDEKRKLAVIRVTHASLETARAALAIMTKVGAKPAAVHVLAVSGTLQALGENIERIFQSV